jgi:regulator of sirC expression with transglutaminase-like and TPR domain
MPNLAIDDQELRALISLLETESEERLSLLLDQIRGFPLELLEHLATLVSQNSHADTHLNLILAQREAPELAGALVQWAAGDADLEEGVLLVARIGYPRVDPESVRAELDVLAGGVAAELPADGGVAAIRHIASVLRDTFGFRGNAAAYYDPDNNYLNRVLATRSGLPISLTVLWILLGKRVGLSISGVALPAHFIGGLSMPVGTVFFDPYYDGAIRSVRDIMNIVSATGRVFHPNHLRSSSSVQIVQRMLMNLLNSYQMQEDMERARLVRQYLAAL